VSESFDQIGELLAKISELMARVKELDLSELITVKVSEDSILAVVSAASALTSVTDAIETDNGFIGMHLG
jgi:hypothetical protein